MHFPNVFPLETGQCRRSFLLSHSLQMAPWKWLGRDHYQHAETGKIAKFSRRVPLTLSAWALSLCRHTAGLGAPTALTSQRLMHAAQQARHFNCKCFSPISSQGNYFSTTDKIIDFSMGFFSPNGSAAAAAAKKVNINFHCILKTCLPPQCL